MMSRSRQIASSGTSRVESVPQQPNNTSTVRVPGTLRLRAENEPTVESNTENRGLHRHIRWSEDVIDNEGMGKKSSKGEYRYATNGVTFCIVLSLSSKANGYGES